MINICGPNTISNWAKSRPIPQFSSEPLGLMIQSGAGFLDPDGNNVTLTVFNVDNNAILLPTGTVATRQSQGFYAYGFNSNQTAIQGNYQATWSYSIGGSPRLWNDYFVIVSEMPFWSSLDYLERQLVVNVFARLENGYDSTTGGSYLQELLQSSFNGYEKMAFLLSTETVWYANFEFQPIFNPPYTVGLGSVRPWPLNYMPILEQGCYVATLNHIARSYIEVPQIDGGLSTTYLNRRDYYARWQNQWKLEKEIYDKSLRQMKRLYLVGSKRSMAIAGGLVPRLGILPTRSVFMYCSVSGSAF